MRQDNLWQDFDTLPPESKKQVMDFISFLQTRYKPTSKRKSKKVRVRNEAFVGIWRGRDDIKDSTAWVRKVRKDH